MKKNLTALLAAMAFVSGAAGAFADDEAQTIPATGEAQPVTTTNEVPPVAPIGEAQPDAMNDEVQPALTKDEVQLAMANNDEAQPATMADAARPVIATVVKPDMPRSNLSITGAVGLPLNPTAELPAYREARVELDYYNLGELSNDSESLDFGTFGAVTPENDDLGEFQMTSLHLASRVGKSRLEISGGVERMKAGGKQTVDGTINILGLIFIDVNSRVDHDDLEKTRPAIGLKYLLLGDEEKPNSLRVAIGGGYNPALFSNTNAYVVATKPFQIGGRRIKVHLGGRYDRFKFESHLLSTVDLFVLGIPLGTFTFTDADFEEKSSKFSVFTGIEVPLDRKGRCSFVGEIATKNSDFDDSNNLDIIADTGQTTSKFPYSAAFRIANSQGLNASIGIMRQGVLDDSGWFVKVGFGF